MTESSYEPAANSQSSLRWRENALPFSGIRWFDLSCGLSQKFDLLSIEASAAETVLPLPRISRQHRIIRQPLFLQTETACARTSMSWGGTLRGSNLQMGF
jgi:hypothetical protein